MNDFCFQTILIQLCVVWLSSAKGAYVPRSQRSAAAPGSPGLVARFNGDFGSPSPSSPSLPNFSPAGFNENNPGGVALPATNYPFDFPNTGFDFTGLQLQPLLQAYAAPAGDFRFPGYGFNVAGYPFDAPSPVLQHFDTAPQLYPTAGNDQQQLRALAAAGLRFDAFPRALPAGNVPTQSLQPVPVIDGESTAKQTYPQQAQQTNDLSAQSITPATAPPKGSNEEPPHQYYNPIGDERQVQVLKQTAAIASPSFKYSPAAAQPQQLQPIQAGNDFTATATPAPTSSNFLAAEPVPDLVLELRPPPFIAPGANPEPSFSSPTNDPSSKPSYSSFSADPINGPGSVSITTGPNPAVATPSPPVNTAFDGAKDALSDPPAGGQQYLRESYSTVSPGLLPDAYPTPSISYSLPSETFRLPTESADAYGSSLAQATDGPRNAPSFPMSPIIVPDHSYPADTPASSGPDTGSSSFPAGYYNAIPVTANAFGSSNPVSANTYSDSNAIQGSSYSNPKLIAGTFFDDSNSISSNSKRESSNVDPSGKSPPPPHYRPNGSK